jgi:hypothetical protein
VRSHGGRRLWEERSTANFLLDFHQVQKEISCNKSICLFPELTLEELVIWCHEYYLLYHLSAATGS